MPDPIDIPSQFGAGVPLSATQLNALQREILRQLYTHTHQGDHNGPALETDAYQNLSVTAPKLADRAVEARALADGAVTARAVADGAIEASALAKGAVKTKHIADGAVTEAKLSAAVQLLLRRTGDSASSASQIIWRDPVVVFDPPPNGPTRPPGWTIIGAISDPVLVDWQPLVIGLNPDGTPIRLNPRIRDIGGVITLEAFEVFDENRPLILTNPLLARAIDEAVLDTSFEIEISRAFEVEGLTGGAIAGDMVTRELDGLVGAGDLQLRTREMGAGLAMRSVSAPLEMSMPVPPPSAAVLPQAKPIKVSLTKSGQQVATRMTSISSIDIDGKPVAKGADGSFTVSAGFVGKESFIEDGMPLEFRSIGNRSGRIRAAKAGREILYNLGIDKEYIASLKDAPGAAQLANIRKAMDGDDTFYLPTNPMWGGQSWLPDILNRPDLFGTGYAISGGRNILDVTRRTTWGDAPTNYVRIRFITPYRNSAYSVSVTPRMKSGFQMISAHIRAKTPDSCDIQFRGLQGNGGVVDVNNLSFDLAVFGQLVGG